MDGFTAQKLRNIPAHYQPAGFERNTTSPGSSVNRLVSAPAHLTRFRSLKNMTSVRGHSVEGSAIKQVSEEIRRKMEHLDRVRTRVNHLQRHARDQQLKERKEKQRIERTKYFANEDLKRLEERTHLEVEEKHRFEIMKEKLRVETERRRIARHSQKIKEIESSLLNGMELRSERHQREQDLAIRLDLTRQKNRLQANKMREKKLQGQLKREEEKQKKLDEISLEKETKRQEMFQSVGDLHEMLIKKQDEEERFLRQLESSIQIRDEVRAQNKQQIQLNALVSPRVRDLEFKPPARNTRERMEALDYHKNHLSLSTASSSTATPRSYTPILEQYDLTNVPKQLFTFRPQKMGTLPDLIEEEDGQSTREDDEERSGSFLEHMVVSHPQSYQQDDDCMLPEDYLTFQNTTSCTLQSSTGHISNLRTSCDSKSSNSTTGSEHDEASSKRVERHAAAKLEKTIRDCQEKVQFSACPTYTGRPIVPGSRF